ncbi:MAG: hypothetical protein IT306_27730 [Chloroflexi bacterium]|nr:hypothetical protein [Chloroflexota bacterium]
MRLDDGVRRASGDRGDAGSESWCEAVVAGVLGTLGSLLFRGFEGGRWSDIPIFKSFVDPRLYLNDPFIQALHEGTPAAYTYRFIAGAIGALPWLPLEWALFVLFVPASVASLGLAYLIARRLVGDRLSAVLFLALYVAGFRMLTVGSPILHSAELTPAFLALPFQLGALYAFLRERHALVGIVAGLGVVIHAPTTSYVGLAIGLAYVLRIRHYGLKNTAIAGGLMVMCSAPTTVGALLQHAAPLPGWALQLARIELATDLSVAVNWGRAGLLLYNVVGGILLAAALLVARPTAERRAVLALFVGVALLCVVAFVFIDVTLRGPISTLVARLQLPRAAWVVDILGLVYVADLLRRSWADTWAPRLVLAVLFGAMLVSPSDFVPLEPIWAVATLLLVAGLAAQRWLPASQRRAVFLGLSVLVGLSLPLFAGLRLLTPLRRLGQFDLDDGLKAAAMVLVILAGWGVHEAARRRLALRGALAAGLTVLLVGAFLVRGSTDWLHQARHRGGLASAAQFQEWARTQTPVDSVFLILPSEPNNDDFYMNADRALYLVRERANQAVYFPSHNEEFRGRVEGLGVSNVLRYREELDQAYRRLTEDRIRELAARYKVTHFVPARAGDFSFPVVYQQGAWTVYEVR